MDVIVIALCGSVHVGLGRAAVRQGWPVLSLGTAVQAMREIRERCPRLVVVQVSAVTGEPIKLIRLLRHGLQPVLVVAVANGHRNPLECLVRDAGANCYLPSADDDESLEQAVLAMLGCVASESVGGRSPGLTMPGPHPAGPAIRPERKGAGR